MIDLPLVSLDLELAGHGDDAEIIEIGAVKFRGEETLGTFSALVAPTAALSYRIGELTGLTEGDFREAEPLERALERLSTFIGGAPLVGQSIGIDVAHLRRAGLRLENPRLDTFELAQVLRPGLESYDLTSIALDLGIVGAAPHRALPDAQLAREVFVAQAACASGLDLNVLSQVVRLVRPLNWPLKLVFAEAQRAAVRELGRAGALPPPPTGVLPATVAEPPSTEPLVENESFERLDVADLVASLESGGPIAATLPGFEERPEQRRMLAAVAQAFNEGETLLVEAGTGTGKSLAYLLPALAFAVANNRRVVISTNTINLQDQLCQKDIPDLLRATGLAARTSVLKGRANYLCLHRWLALLGADELAPAERTLLVKTLLWLPRTSSGDRAELKLTPDEEEVWGKLAAVAEACSPRRCPFHRDGVCFVARARRAAEAAHLIVVNHSLLLADVMTGSQVLPHYSHLVVDEAHHLEDEATSQLGHRVTEREAARRLNELVDSSPAGPIGLLADAAAALRGTANGAESAPAAVGQREVEAVRAGLRRLFRLLLQALKAHSRSADGGHVTWRITSGARSQPAWSEIDVLWGEVGRDVLALQRTLGELVLKLEEGAARDDKVAALAAELATQVSFWDENRVRLGQVIAEPDPNIVAWLTLGQAEDVWINAAPLHVGDVLRDRLVGPKESVVLTSATLTTQGSFRYVRERLGLLDGRELTVGSPFDYAASTLVYVPTDTPEPNQTGYQRAVERIVLDVATELRGRTLVLFTSHNHLRTTHRALRDALDARRVILLGQRVDGSSRSRLLETFKSGRPSVLMGTSSFWEGIDVVGEALSCLIIARLPFPIPTDPIVEARSEQFEDPFRQYSLPQAVLRFRQGFGRLIRSGTDRGTIIVLDGRLRTRGYGRAFLGSLPPCQVRSGPARDAGRLARAWIEADSSADVAAMGSRT